MPETSSLMVSVQQLINRPYGRGLMAAESASISGYLSSVALVGTFPLLYSHDD